MRRLLSRRSRGACERVPASSPGDRRAWLGDADGIALDAVVLAAFAAMKWKSDPLIVVIDIVGMARVFLDLLDGFRARKIHTNNEHHQKSLSFQALEAAS